jgi:hypothetical protein
MAVPRKGVPVKINGDDITFRAKPSEVESWKEGVAKGGLVLSKGKTLVHKKYFTINSTFWEGRVHRKPSYVPVIRSKCIYKTDAYTSPLSARLKKCAQGFWSEAKTAIHSTMLRFHRKAFKRMGCSFSRGMGYGLSMPTLIETNFLADELHYLARSPPEDELPQIWRESSGKIEGWSRVRKSTVLLSKKEIKDYQRAYEQKCIDSTWEQSVAVGEKKEEFKGVSFGNFSWSKKHHRL